MAVLKSDFAVPERAPIVFLFVETRGFTRTSEILEPPVVLARVAEFFAFVTAIVERHAGAVFGALNDTVLATFAGPDDAKRAVQAAQEIQRDFSALEEAWHHDYGIRAAVAMGLHRGDAVIGMAGGAASDKPLIVGDSVSIAERLLHRARAGELVLSKMIVDGLAVSRFALETEELPPLKIPRREPIELFGVLVDTRLDFT